MYLYGCLREALRLHIARHQPHNQHSLAIVKPLAQQHCLSESLFSVQASEHSSETSTCVLTHRSTPTNDVFMLSRCYASPDASATHLPMQAME